MYGKDPRVSRQAGKQEGGKQEGDDHPGFSRLIHRGNRYRVCIRWAKYFRLIRSGKHVTAAPAEEEDPVRRGEGDGE
jgi:hypothetical protein